MYTFVILVLCAAAFFPTLAQAHEIDHFHVHGVEITIYHVFIVVGIIGHVCLRLFSKGDQ